MGTPSTKSLIAISASLAVASGALIVLCSAVPLAPAELALLCAIVAGLSTLSLLYYGCALVRGSGQDGGASCPIEVRGSSGSSSRP